MGEPAEQAAFIQAGANMLIHSADIKLFARHLQQDLLTIKRLIGESPIEPTRASDVHI
jgi:hypothetical protein